jgi:hypothetical protein
MIILLIYSLSLFGVLGLLVCQGGNCALLASGVWNIIGSWLWSTHPLFQLIQG